MHENLEVLLSPQMQGDFTEHDTVPRSVLSSLGGCHCHHFTHKEMETQRRELGLAMLTPALGYLGVGTVSI